VTGQTSGQNMEPLELKEKIYITLQTKTFKISGYSTIPCDR
jgi:hypothetical protein